MSHDHNHLNRATWECKYHVVFTPDPNALVAECTRLGLEGIVAKRRDSPYRSGTRSGWIKVKTPEWKAANQYRARLFEKPGRSSSVKGRAG